MSPKVREWAKQQRTGLGTRKLVLMVLASYADDDGEAIATVPQIAHDAELTRNGTQRVIRQLEEAGLIIRKLQTSEGGRSMASKFCLLI